MWRQIIFVLPLTLSTLAIRVPVDGKDEKVTETPKPSGAPEADKKQDIFYITDQGTIDSYLIPPDPHQPAEVLPDLIATPSTFLLPPSPDSQIDYYTSTEAGEQSDWYPIAQQAAAFPSEPVHLPPQISSDAIPVPVMLAENETLEVYTNNIRGGKAYGGSGDRFNVPVPSRQLEPPLIDAPNDYLVQTPSESQEIPSAEIDQIFYIPTPTREEQITVRKPNRKKPRKNVMKIIAAEPTLSLELVPPKPIQLFKKPTKLYPKKVTKSFHPIPIPISQFVEESPLDVPRAKPANPFKPVSSEESEYFTPSDEKQLYIYEQIEQKRRLKGENEQYPATAAEDTYGVNAPAEQETSETNYRQPGPNIPVIHVVQPIRQVPRPLRLQAVQLRPSPPPQQESSQQESSSSEESGAPAAPPPAGERTEFRMHGMKGPHSYQFGFDTGKGKNRQFRYEERDNDGKVKGHYGYMDRHGKLRVVNYGADPETGFHADAPVEKER